MLTFAEAVTWIYVNDPQIWSSDEFPDESQASIQLIAFIYKKSVDDVVAKLKQLHENMK